MADRIDSRQLVEKLESLSADYQIGEMHPSEMKELQELERVVDELRGITDPEDGITMVPEDQFEDYAREYAEDTGALSLRVDTYDFPPKVVSVADEWPFTHIDWKAAAEALAEDWTEVEYEGVTYLCR